MNIFDNITYLTKTFGGTHTAKMLLRQIKTANTIEMSQIIYKMNILENKFTHLYTISNTNFKDIWHNLWQYYCTYNSGINIINGLLEQVSLNYNQVTNVIENLSNGFENLSNGFENQQNIIWWLLIQEKYQIPYQVSELSPQIIRLYCAQFYPNLVSQNLVLLDQCVCPEFILWKEIWWRVFNKSWKINPQASYLYLNEKFDKVSFFITEIGFAKKLLRHQLNDWNHLLKFNQSSLAELWLKCIPKGLNFVPVEFYKFSTNNWKLFIEKINPTNQILYDLINLEIESDILKKYITDQLEKKKILPEELIFSLITHGMAKLIKDTQFKNQDKLAKYLVSRNYWDNNLIDSLFLFKEDKAKFILLECFQNNQNSCRALKVMGVTNIYYELAQLSYNSSDFQQYTRKHFLRIKQGNKRRVIEKDTPLELNYPMCSFDFNIKNIGFHKFLLVRFSDFFCEVFKESFKDTELVIPFSREEIRHLHAFIYHNQVGKCTYLDYKLADYLSCRCWKHLILQNITKSLSNSNLEDALQIYQKSLDQNLKMAIINLLSSPQIDQIEPKLAQLALSKIK